MLPNGTECRGGTPTPTLREVDSHAQCVDKIEGVGINAQNVSRSSEVIQDEFSAYAKGRTLGLWRWKKRCC